MVINPLSNEKSCATGKSCKLKCGFSIVAFDSRHMLFYLGHLKSLLAISPMFYLKNTRFVSILLRFWKLLLLAIQIFSLWHPVACITTERMTSCHKSYRLPRFASPSPGSCVLLVRRYQLRRHGPEIAVDLVPAGVGRVARTRSCRGLRDGPSGGEPNSDSPQLGYGAPGASLEQRLH